MRTAIACPEPEEPAMPRRVVTVHVLAAPGVDDPWINPSPTANTVGADTWWAVLDVQPRCN